MVMPSMLGEKSQAGYDDGKATENMSLFHSRTLDWFLFKKKKKKAFLKK